MRVLQCGLVLLVLLVLGACGGSSSSASNSGSVNNWQFTLVQEFPRPETSLLLGGFLKQSTTSLNGSVTTPTSTQNGACAGVGIVSGSISGSNLSLQLSNGGSALSLSGTLSSDGNSMQGTYSGPGGGCYTASTSGTWSAVKVPTLSGNFTGSLTSSSYMALLTGENPAPPVSLSGTFTQGPNDGSASSADLTGTITASSYPCFRTVDVTGSISGQSVRLSVFSFNGTLIGTIGIPSAPASVTSGASGLSLVGTGPGTSGLALGGVLNPGSFGPCPPLPAPGGGTVPYDAAAIQLTFGVGAASNVSALQPSKVSQ